MTELAFASFAVLLLAARVAVAVLGFGPGRAAHNAQRRRSAAGH